MGGFQSALNMKEELSKIEEVEMNHEAEIKKDTTSSDISHKGDDSQPGSATKETTNENLKSRSQNITDLVKVLEFITLNESERGFFNKNGNKDLYVRFK